jgi:hypothetical protein
MEVALEAELGAGRHGGWSEDGAATLNATGGGGGRICSGPRKSLVRAGVKWEGGGCALLCGGTTPLQRELSVAAERERLSAAGTAMCSSGAVPQGQSRAAVSYRGLDRRGRLCALG